MCGDISLSYQRVHEYVISVYTFSNTQRTITCFSLTYKQSIHLVDEFRTVYEVWTLLQVPINIFSQKSIQWNLLTLVIKMEFVTDT